MDQTESAISDYYRGKTIFITGASGFIGKVLIWKLLQSCSNLDTIFILVRPKKGRDKDSRVTDLFEVPIFENFKKDNKQILDKVKAIAGDIGEDNLGISEEDERKLVDSVHVIFHIAATVRFDTDLKDAVNLNVAGTKRLLELATRMPKLEAFVHTSTAFCHSDVDELEEKLYKTRESPQEIIDLVRWMTPEALRSIKNELIKPHPNTYTYSKRLAENLVADYYPKLPVAIVRPSIVSPALCEPIPGWIDNMNGIIGTFIALGKGVLRVFWCDKDCGADFIPVDFVCNMGLIAVAWKIGKDRSRNPKDGHAPIYNVCAGERGLLKYNEVREYWKKFARDEYPFSLVLWYPTVVMYKNFYIYIALITFLQWIPACLIDGLLYVFGRRTIMIRVQRKIYHGVKTLNYFATRQWKFIKKNTSQIRDELSEKDKEIFGSSDTIENMREYYIALTKVSRWYIMKEDPNNLPRARRTHKLLYVLHCLMKLVFWLALFRILYTVAVAPNFSYVAQTKSGSE